MAQPNPCGTTLQSSNHRAHKSLTTGARDKPEPALNNNTRRLCPAVSCFHVTVKCHICKYLSLFKMLNQTKMAQIMQLTARGKLILNIYITLTLQKIPLNYCGFAKTKELLSCQASDQKTDTTHMPGCYSQQAVYLIVA